MTTPSRTPTLEASGPFVLEIPFETLSDSIPGAADGTAVQLGPSVGPFVFEIVDLGDVTVTRDTYGSDMSLVAKGRQDAVTIAGTIGVTGPGRWDGRELEAGLWGAYETGGVHASTCRVGQVNGEIIIDRGAIEEAIVALGRGPRDTSSLVSHLEPGEAARMAEIHRRAGFDGNGTEPVALRQEILESAARVLSSASRSDQRRARRLSSKGIVTAALAYAEQFHGRRPTILELCRATAVSERRLMYAFEEVVGVSPRRYLTLIALTHVNAHLVEASPGEALVGDIAMRHGFNHLGRFASDYRRIYGESPSETLTCGNRAGSVRL